MQQHHAKVGEGGRVIIPAAFRKALNLHIGEELIICLQNGEIRIYRQSQALQNIRAAVKHKCSEKLDYIDDFLAFRKQDSE